MFVNTQINLSYLPALTKSKIYKNIAPVIFGLILSAIMPGVASAETVMEKVARTGVLTAGTSRDALPFAYSDSQGKLTGYSVDMLGLIQQQLEKESGKKIKLKLVAVTPAERIPKIINRQVDIVCDASSFTWERDKKVDFSISYGVTGTQILIKKNSNLGSPESLINKRVGVLAGTTNEQVIKQIQPQAKLVYLRTRPEGFAALEQGKVDAFASDSILLEGWLQTAKNQDSFAIVPPRPYSREGIACMVPENNSKFLNSVNYSLVKFMQGFVNNNPKYVAIFDHWFGYQGVVYLNRDLRDLAVETMQLMIEFHEAIPQKDL
ncbi:amino acid ABC transporter substrate-binding protein [Aphanizomenon flos-aquae NRERC-008]|uniref:Amino acid ABC transporter substrate-binding protein n=1 Tax=Aphanizomenon flos-aquae FACHB-1249 TaxID=2692889 RepID=A0ABR8IVD7_APHFL|nr:MULTISPECIES: amino acid ABC transporter substrate-binding protein [Aphanizomenon]MBD2389325.1 amino acid ABC transporter substrate-binding protein [Aphanizomenon flos-aquae FACHB-1171]MBD2555300.1 amino acid ABC transporter substrate-binding protein [Aphanizomenon flos-aquae FACHB-1290]MBD2633030.1 amino acid ABC transporter substrate-binding protein [Aphanizomenon sp. FACHB-1399]MBD2643990.1 amino acid ABC transporter substrate-binding protein [Aphanizomenon sp. FACHB-1401]MBD2656150.1 am